MASTHLNEHDANQGAQSSGEFLGMTGNSGWYLLGSAGATILLVILLWGVLGLSLLLCLLLGLVLCGLSVAYVFALKNNRPKHFDTDFFESALVEAGVMQFTFGPRTKQPTNPFTDAGVATIEVGATAQSMERRRAGIVHGGAVRQLTSDATVTEHPQEEVQATRPKEEEPVVTSREHERLLEQLATTEEMLEDALAERGEA